MNHPQSSLPISPSWRSLQVKPSMTLAITAKAIELKSKGVDIIGLSAGEPDFDTPKPICEAAINAINEGITRYTAVDGIVALREQVCKKLLNHNQLTYTSDEVIINVGAKQGIFNICQALLNPGDEVIIPAPYWVSYPDIVRLSRG